jgi:glycosyltransferase involved in cell wall biosynthesis
VTRETTKQDPLVSVILPFLNGGPAFEPALGSMLRQSYRNWELLLCDDGSTDGSLELARGLRDPRVTVWSDSKTKGLAARLNECIERARGVYIARMDADDLSYPQRLERQVAFLESHARIDVVGCPMLIFGEEGEPLGRRSAPEDHAGIVANPALGFGLAHPTWMARAAWYRRHRYDPAAVRYEDAELLQRSHTSSQFANLPDLLYGYREMRGGFRKRLKTRLGRIRYLAARRSDLGTGLLLRAAAAESVKTLADAALTATSTRYSMLRRREDPLNALELAEWRNVMASATQPASAAAPLTLTGAAKGAGA